MKSLVPSWYKAFYVVVIVHKYLLSPFNEVCRSEAAGVAKPWTGHIIIDNVCALKLVVYLKQLNHYFKEVLNFVLYFV